MALISEWEWIRQSPDKQLGSRRISSPVYAQIAAIIYFFVIGIDSILQTFCQFFNSGYTGNALNIMKNFTSYRLSVQAFLTRLAFILLISGGGKVSGQTYTIQVGTGGTTSPNVPINANYSYNYSQQLYTAADITTAGGTPGKIRKIRFYLIERIRVTYSSDLIVYMGNVDKESFDSDTDWVPLAGMTEVFKSTVDYPASGPGWIEISLQADFIWDGSSNIVVAIDENTPGFGSMARWQTTTVQGANRSIYYRDDSNNPDPGNPPAATGRLAGFPNAQFEWVQTPCSSDVLTGNAMAIPSALCESETVALTLQGDLFKYSGLQYQWQSSPDGITNWQVINESDNYSYTTEVSTTTWFRAILTCGPSVVMTTPVNVLVHGLPDVTINAANLATCGAAVTLTASGDAGFEWSPAQGLNVTTGPTVQAAPAAPTVYTVTGTDNNNCQNTARVAVSPLALYRPQLSNFPASSCTAGVPVSITVTNPLENPGAEYELRDTVGNAIIPWQSAASFTVTPDEEGAFVYDVVARIPDCESLSLPAEVRLYQSFAADVSTILDCDVNSAAIHIGNARGAGQTAEIWENDFSDPMLPPAVTLFGSASVTDGRAVITPSAASQKGGLQLSGITAVNPQAIAVAFKLTSDQPINNFGTGGGDGLAWSFGDDADYASGITNGAGAKLRLVFDAANNGTENGNTRGIYLTYGYSSNVQMGPGSAGTIAYSADTESWKTRTDTPVLITIDESSRLTLTINEQIIFDDIQLPAEYAAADKSQWKHLFSAFTGGDALRQAITDLTITFKYEDFLYGISAGGSGTLPVTWQSSDTFADLASPGNYDVWIASTNNPDACYKLLTTSRLLHPINISSVSKTELTGCESNDGTITLSGLVANEGYQVDYLSSVSGNYSVNMTTDGAGKIVLEDLSPATYSDIFVSGGSCISAAVDPVVIEVPVKPALLAFSSGSNTDCTTPNGSISLFSTDFVPGANYEIWYNGASRGSQAADTDRLITLTGLATGDYSDIYVVTLQHCTSNIIPSRTVTGVGAGAVITGASAATPSNCNSATGSIQLDGSFNAGSASVSYRRNGIPALVMATASAGTLDLNGLSPGVYDGFSVTSGCASNVWNDAVVVDIAGAPAPASGNAFKTDVQGAGVTVDYYDSSCGRIATLNSSDGSLGNVSVIVTVTGSTGTYHNQPYIGRYYDIQTGSAAGGTVTLYFTDAEINQYNAQVAILGNPVFPAIGENGENLRITVFHSTAPGSGPEGYDPMLSESISPTEVTRHASGFWQVTFVTTSFSGFFAHTNQNNSPLPVKLKSLEASNEGLINKVYWSTSEEAVGDHFVVERSADGRNFAAICVVHATGTPGNDYHVVDNSPFNGINYYRLKVENEDGSHFYSTIVAAKHDSGIGGITIGPNPVGDQLTVRLNDKAAGAATLRLIDMTGRVIHERAVEGENSVQFSMQHLRAGIYIVQFLNGHFVQSVKVMKE